MAAPLVPALPAALFRWLALAAWRQQPGAVLAAVVAVAMGVALGLGINLVNRSALDEFDDALTRINGQAQYRLTGAGSSVPDTVLTALEHDQQVASASPVIQTDVLVEVGAGRTQRLTVIGLDIFRAAQVAPALLPRPVGDHGSGAASALFSDDAVFLSNAAARVFDVSPGNTLTIRVNGRQQALRVAGDVPGADGDLPIAVMDIGAAQFRLDWLGRLSRIDLRLVEGAEVQTVLARLRARDAAYSAVQILRPDNDARRMSNLSRAYRINLNVLALVALLTGGFIVYASMELAVLRMMPMLALLGVLGAQPAMRSQLVTRLALALGVGGAVLGIALGVGLAWLLLGLVGGDLGGGYFAANRPSLSLPPLVILLFGGLGVLVALAGALSPALRLRRVAPAGALRAGQATQLGGLIAPTPIATLLAVVGGLLLLVPAIGGLPLAAYAAIACWLFAGVLIVAPMLGYVAHRLAAIAPRWRSPLAWLAAARLARAHRNTFPALAGVVASFALVCAMAIMVYSFRVSVDNWLETVLPADIYLRVPTSGAQAGLSDTDRQAIAAIADVERVSFLRSIDLDVAPEEPAVALIARAIARDSPQTSLPLTGPSLPPSALDADCTPVWASEPAANRFDWSLGAQITLPLPGAGNASRCLQIMGIWRDYARQQGAVAINDEDYRELTGDTSVSDAALWLREGVRPEAAMAAARIALVDLPGVEMRSASDIRTLSLHIFDRSFAVTYALEAVALLVGLFGVATTWSGEALSRAREFGMLRHLGVTRAKLVALFATESGFAIGLGVIWGAALGALIAQVLIHRVNPQSFNWTMATHWPVGLLAGSAMALIGLGVLTAMFAARRAASTAPIAAVRADW